MTPIPLISLGGAPDKPLLHLAPANGFVLEVYQPLLRPFFAEFHCVSLPPRALWQDIPPAIEAETSWRDDTGLLRDAVQQHHLPPMIGIGHSFGGIITMLAHEAFRAIILLDPTILIRPAIDYVTDLRQQGRALENPLAQSALRRRRTFASVDEAYANFRSKSVFADWPDEVLHLYAEYGTRPTETGERTLTWTPEWEAYYFSTIPSGVWEQIVPSLHKIKAPALILRGGTSETYTADSAREVAEAWPQVEHEEVAGHGHLFPQSAPEAAAQQIRAWMMREGLL